MNRTYEKPVMEVERFESNEYVASCQLTLKCEIYDGVSVTDGTKGLKGADGLLHGTPCQNNVVTYDSLTGEVTGYETKEGSTIYDVDIANGTWKSNDSYGNVYSHVGSATLNHS